MSRRHKKKRLHGDVELNLAAMLDMAFQLLTFFILTFQVAPVEGQITLRLPPAQPVTGAKGAPPAGQANSKDPVQSLDTFLISVFKSQDKNNIEIIIGAPEDKNVAQGNNTAARVNSLKSKLKAAFSGNVPFDQVIVQVDSDVRYDELMQVIDACAGQKLPNGDPLTKLSFVEVDFSKQ